METVVLDKVPSQLTGIDQWVLWKSIVRDGRATKVPYQPNGVPASSTDSSTWATVYDCLDVASRFDGIGFVFTKEDSFIGVDLDGCIGSDGKMLDWAREVVSQLGSYAEISPSGTGVKIFGTTSEPWNHRKKVELLDYPSVSDKSPGVEVYDSGRYFAVTGKRLKGFSLIQSLDNHLDWLADRFGMRLDVPSFSTEKLTLETPVSERAAKYVSKMSPSVSGQDGHKKCFKAACAREIQRPHPAPSSIIVKVPSVATTASKTSTHSKYSSLKPGYVHFSVWLSI
jgi:primase-polymerase (primpol)-like protein